MADPFMQTLREWQREQQTAYAKAASPRSKQEARDLMRWIRTEMQARTVPGRQAIDPWTGTARSFAGPLGEELLELSSAFELSPVRTARQHLKVAQESFRKGDLPKAMSYLARTFLATGKAKAAPHEATQAAAEQVEKQAKTLSTFMTMRMRALPKTPIHFPERGRHVTPGHPLAARLRTAQDSLSEAERALSTMDVAGAMNALRNAVREASLVQMDAEASGEYPIANMARNILSAAEDTAESVRNVSVLVREEGL